MTSARALARSTRWSRTPSSSPTPPRPSAFPALSRSSLELLLTPPAWLCELGRTAPGSSSTSSRRRWAIANSYSSPRLARSEPGSYVPPQHRRAIAPEAWPPLTHYFVAQTTNSHHTTVQKNKGTKKIIAKLTLSNSEPVNFRVNLKITGIMLS